ncbi:hypothetical protein SLEP1_g31378 [Rubroshorea leprosula]|uniref:Reverse transcriptase domain-containing protein n=1 Tax=Rubroshorea leprosula TaxID=152421 RepID=A0AAV5K359_9ROSI|nr:hypothetical protein SLEP1_g31378 [Rubroshorea leprosula]
MVNTRSTQHGSPQQGRGRGQFHVFGVFQLVHAQLLARDNLGDPFIALLNPTNHATNHQPQQNANSLVRSAVSPHRESQGQSYMAPPPPNPPQVVALDVSKRLDNLEKMMAENRNAIPSTESSSTSIPIPLNLNILQESYPPKFKMPQFETYGGAKDPDDHLHVMGVELPDNKPDDETKATSVEKVEEVQIDDNDPTKKTQIGTKLNPREREELIGFLKANKDVFAWTSTDMLEILTSIAVHKLSTNPLKKLGTIRFTWQSRTRSRLPFMRGIRSIVMNLEVYVDDIIVKSLKVEDHLIDLAEMFDNLRKHSMRLNPTKCVFGVELGKFLGFMVSKRGIEINPKKIKAIEEMKPPKSIKDVQHLIGRVATLHRFISKSADKCLPFFKVLSEHALKFNFAVTNNMAEYEALLLGLRSTAELKRFQLTKVSRTKNEQANFLSRLGSNNSDGMRSVYVEVLNEPSFQRSKEDAKLFVERCQKCRLFSHLTHQPAKELINFIAPWPFAQWSIDFLGPFIKGVRGVTHLVVAVDYFTKWVEARPLSSYGIKLVFTSVCHPEANGMIESVNKVILKGIKLRLDQFKAKWVDKLNNVLWAYRTTCRTIQSQYSLFLLKTSPFRNSRYKE